MLGGSALAAGADKGLSHDGEEEKCPPTHTLDRLVVGVAQGEVRRREQMAPRTRAPPADKLVVGWAPREDPLRVHVAGTLREPPVD